MATDYLIAKIFSRAELTPEIARAQLKWLASVDDGRYAPEKCDVYEPVKKAFDPAQLDEPVRWLAQPGGMVLLKRSKPVAMEGYLKNRRFPAIRVRPRGERESRPLPPKVPEPVFRTAWTIWIGEKAIDKFGLDSLRGFLLGAFDIAQADYAFLTPESDYRAKNFLVTREGSSTVEEFVGDDPQHGIPGLYWMNIFGADYIDWFGAAKVAKVKATRREKLARGTVLEFGTTPGEAASGEFTAAQAEAARVLGVNAFFQIAARERVLDVPDFCRPSAAIAVEA